jgi:uncharacterized protein YaaR (DUF327 family)
MYKNKEGKWVNGSAAKAKYHLQVRCNKKMMEMTSHYLNELCGDDTTPRETVMTARAKVNEKSGGLEEPKKTIVKKYSFTYAMAFERLSQGKGLVSRSDRQTITLLDELIGLVRKILPMATDKETEDAITSWQDRLREAYDYIDNGRTPRYLTDYFGCWPEQLQLVMKMLYKERPNDDWRLDIDEIKYFLIKHKLVENINALIKGEPMKKDDKRTYWRNRGRLELDSRYNIRTSTRFPADEYNSDKVRGWLEWIIDVPVSSNDKDRKMLINDIKIVSDLIKETRRFPKTKRAKEEIGFMLKDVIHRITTNSEKFIKRD